MAYRILSLDGGGSWALLEAMALGAIFGADRPGHAILREFDLCAANSGGSLVLAGLVEGLTPREIEGLFKTEAIRRSLFDADEVERGPLGDQLLRLAGIGPRYSAARKLAGIFAASPKSGAQPLTRIPELVRGPGGRAAPHLLICAYDYDRNRSVVFRTDAASPAASFAGAIPAMLGQAVHASTNAPVNFFDGPAEISLNVVGRQSRRFWDGGIAGLNNPSLAAVMEALAYGKAPDEIAVLSLGTGTVIRPVRGDEPGEADPRSLLVDRGDPEVVADLRKLATSILDDPPDSATYWAHIVLRHRLPRPSDPLPVASPSLVRLSPVIQPVRRPDGGWRLPSGLDAETFDRLVALEIDAVEDEEVALIERLGRAWIENRVPNQPIRMNRDTLAAEIGHGTFSDGAADWQLSRPEGAALTA